MKFLLLLLIIPVSLAAFDFGLTTSQYGGFKNDFEDDTFFEYSGSLLPRFSVFFGETGSFYASAALNFNVNNNDKDDDFIFVPELLRTEFSYRSGTLGVRAGRMNYVDPLGFIANGLFDGYQITHTSPLGRFALGTWYTGLQYKKTTRIGMTAEERQRNDDPLDYDDFADTYFSSSRLLAAFDWEHPSFAETLRLRSSLIAQFDLRDAEEKINTQYFVIKASLPVTSFVFEAGGGIQLAQTDSEIMNDIFVAFAWNLGIFWTLPTSFHNRLALTADFASGKINQNSGSFVSLTSAHNNSGGIFQPILTNLTVFALNYTARIIDPLGINFNASYYIRNRKEHYSDNNFHLGPENYDGHFLGQEFLANIIWNPFSDLQLNLGGGIFIPELGDVWDDQKPQWKVSLTATFAIY